MQTLRVPKAKFKYNMAPFIKAAVAGKQVIVTKSGTDEFLIVPCAPTAPPPGVSVALSAKAYKGVDLDEPAFQSWGQA